MSEHLIADPLREILWHRTCSEVQQRALYWNPELDGGYSEVFHYELQNELRLMPEPLIQWATGIARDYMWLTAEQQQALQAQAAQRLVRCSSVY